VTKAIVVYITTPDHAEAEALAKKLVEEELASCVTIIPATRSLYRWRGKVCNETESLLMVKTVRSRFDALAARVTLLHSYDIPEIIALPVLAGSEPYLEWLGA